MRYFEIFLLYNYLNIRLKQLLERFIIVKHEKENDEIMVKAKRFIDVENLLN